MCNWAFSPASSKQGISEAYELGVRDKGVRMRQSKLRKAARKDLSKENRLRKKKTRKKSEKQIVKDRMPTRHHILPSSRGGNSSAQNISMLRNKKHQAYHTLFSNMTPDEIITFLVYKCWNKQWQWVQIAIEEEKYYGKEKGGNEGA